MGSYRDGYLLDHLTLNGIAYDLMDGESNLRPQADEAKWLSGALDVAAFQMLDRAMDPTALREFYDTYMTALMDTSLVIDRRILMSDEVRVAGDLIVSCPSARFRGVEASNVNADVLSTRSFSVSSLTATTLAAGSIAASNLAASNGRSILQLDANNVSFGVLPTARGGTGTQTSTGAPTSCNVLSDGPTLVSPIVRRGTLSNCVLSNCVLGSCTIQGQGLTNVSGRSVTFVPGTITGSGCAVMSNAPVLNNPTLRTPTLSGPARFTHRLALSNQASAPPSESPDAWLGGEGDRLIIAQAPAGTGQQQPFSIGYHDNAVWTAVPAGASNLWYNGTMPMAQLANGDFTCTGEIRSFASVSDRSLKENVRTIPGESGISAVMALRPVTFNWRKDVFHNPAQGAEDAGFVAQEVEETLPVAVSDLSMMNQRSYKGIRHERLIPYMVSAIQELSRRLDQALGRLCVDQR